MNLEEIHLSKRQISILEKKNITSAETLLRFFPLRYLDCSTVTDLRGNKEFCCITARVINVKKTDSSHFMVYADCVTETGRFLKVVWFHALYMYDKIRPLVDKTVLICGCFEYSPYHRCMQTINPFLFTKDMEGSMKIYPVYSKIKGIRDSSIQSFMKTALNACCLKDYYEPEFVERYNLMPLGKALREMHTPTSMESADAAAERFMFDDMLYFTLMEEKIRGEIPVTSSMTVEKTGLMEQVKSGLPYTLTDDQEKVLYAILEDMKDGKRVNGLIQGDVSCGKSIVCFLLAIAMAENGYQTAIMTPNRTLARQHYDDLVKLTEGFGLKTAFIQGTSEMKAKERKEALKALADGEIDIVVGTTSLIAESVKYKNLGMAVVDEEHKFGVIQRDNLMKKGMKGVHTLIMSATPIPRTIAQTVYNENTSLYTINTMPPGRLRTLNCVTDSWAGVKTFLTKELQKGHQAYIICQLITDSDKRKTNAMTSEKLYDYYSDCFSKLGYKVAVLHGKVQNEEFTRVMEDFKDNKIQILVATSVVEVGVNVPNATAMVIHDAEKFGLASLHQLRGRIGRGTEQAYCVFFTSEPDNPRMKIISSTNNGFEIAMKDAEMRKTGDMLRGVRQSGKNKYVDMILANREKYAIVKQAAAWLKEQRKLESYLSAMIEFSYGEEGNN